MAPRDSSAKKKELFKSKQYGQNLWRVYKHGSTQSQTTPRQLGTIKYTPNPDVNSWSVFGSSPYIFTVTNNPYSNGDTIIFTTGNPPSGVSVGLKYYVMNVSGDTFNIGPYTGGGPI
jgi:hypothetical protein